MTECSCWCEYPNLNHKKDNGKWKCKDNYECVRNLERIKNKHGGYYLRKTKCIKKGEGNG